MTNLIKLKQTVPHEEQTFPFTSLLVQPDEKQILHLHWHEEWEIIYITKGKGVFNIGAENVVAEKGDLLFVNKGLIHTGFSVDDSIVEYHVLIFHQNLLETNFGDNTRFPIAKEYTSEKSSFPLHIKSDEPNQSKLITIINSIFVEYEEQSEGYQSAISSLLHLLIVNIARYYPRKSKSTFSNKYDKRINEEFKKVFNYIKADYYDKITVEQAASTVNLSTYHFCRTFKKLTGKTFVEYLNLYRLNMAEKLLLTTDLPITQIAYDVGFGSINYFCQMFKQYKLVSPSQFRKNQKSSVRIQ